MDGIRGMLLLCFNKKKKLPFKVYIIFFNGFIDDFSGMEDIIEDIKFV
jgi:hypothetical protein